MLGRTPEPEAAKAVQAEWLSKPHKSDLVGQSPRMGPRRLLNHSACAARGFAYEGADLYDGAQQESQGHIDCRRGASCKALAGTTPATSARAQTAAAAA